MARENFLAGAPRIHCERRRLGFSISQPPRSIWLLQAGDRDSRGGRFSATKPPRFAVAQIALVGAHSGYCGGSPLLLPIRDGLPISFWVICAPANGGSIYGDRSALEAPGTRDKRRF